MNVDWRQIVALFILAIPIACVARTVIFEEIFREPREWCHDRSASCRRLLQRKFFYVFTCEYCFSHWVTLVALFITHYKLLYDDWRGYVVAFFSLVFVANAYLNLYSRLRVELASQKKEMEATQQTIDVKKVEIDSREREIGALSPDTGTGSTGSTDGDGQPAPR